MISDFQRYELNDAGLRAAQSMFPTRLETLSLEPSLTLKGRHVVPDVCMYHEVHQRSSERQWLPQLTWDIAIGLNCIFRGVWEGGSHIPGLECRSARITGPDILQIGGWGPWGHDVELPGHGTLASVAIKIPLALQLFFAVRPPAGEFRGSCVPLW